jgi:LacI family transcriptional regulator
MVNETVKNERKTGLKSEVRRIGLFLNSGLAFDRAIARGIGEFVRSHRGWVVFMDPMFKASEEALPHWNLDGIIMDLQSDVVSAAIKLKGIPCVAVGAYSEERHGHLQIPVIASDHREIGRQAARHFIDRGFRSFAFCADETRELDWCRDREEGFAEVLAQDGFGYNRFEPPIGSTVEMTSALNAIGNWLHTLPAPTAVFTHYDGWARWVLDACIIEGIKVPQKVAVLGVDNDRWLCGLSQPQLSSVDPNVLNIGYVAAETLTNAVEGKPVFPGPIRIAPSGVIVRDSTDLMAFSDPLVAMAIRYIREHACDPISPTDVLKVTGMSNSTAYRRFMTALGRSVHGEIQRVQLEAVRDLLVSTNLSVTAIAQQAGFGNVRYLTKVFREATGMTPTEFRRTQSTPGVNPSPSPAVATPAPARS